MPDSRKKSSSVTQIPLRKSCCFPQVHLILMSVAHWNLLSLFKNHSIHQRGLPPPTNKQHLHSAASPAAEGRGCQRWMLDMSSAICRIYLVTEYSWALKLVSAFSQPCNQQQLYCHQTGLILRHPSSCPFPKHPLFCFVFFNKVVLLALRRCGTTQWKRPVKKRGKRSGYNPMFRTHAHLLPLTPLGTRSDLCRDPDSRFALAHAFPFCSEETAPNSMRITRAFGRPGRCSASSRLPLTVVWQRRRAAVWGQAHLAWQQRLQRLSH